jgi:hypothetical protein
MRQKILTLVTILVISGCGKSGGGGGQVVNPNPPPSGSVVLPAGSQVGFYAQTSNLIVPGYSNNGSSLSVGPAMSAVLRDAMGVCDREYISGGLAACSTWTSGAFDFVLLADGGAQANTVKLILRAVPGSQLNNYGWYSYSLPSFKQAIACLIGLCWSNPQGIFNPLVLEATIWPINNSQGFEVRAYGPRVSRAWNQLFQLQVAQGKLEDAQWNFALQYAGQQAAQGRAVRCQSQNCGLDSSIVRGY